MTDIKKTIQEAQQILAELKRRADTCVPWTTPERAAMESRINHLMNVTAPEFAGNKLEVGLLDLRDNIDNQIQNQADKVAQLAQEVTEKNGIITYQTEQIQQLSALTAKLDTISQGLDKADSSQELANLKANLQSLKDKQEGANTTVNATTSTIQTQTEKLTKANKEIQQNLSSTKTIAYFTGTTGSLSFLGLLWLIFKDTFKGWFNRKVEKRVSDIQELVKDGLDKV